MAFFPNILISRIHHFHTRNATFATELMIVCSLDVISANCILFRVRTALFILAMPKCRKLSHSRRVHPSWKLARSETLRRLFDVCYHSILSQGTTPLGWLWNGCLFLHRKHVHVRKAETWEAEHRFRMKLCFLHCLRVVVDCMTTTK